MTSNATATVLRWRQDSWPRERALRELWGQLRQRNWVNPSAPRVVVRVGQGWCTPVVTETAASLGNILRTWLPEVEVRVLDAPLRATEAGQAIRVAGIRTPELIVPMDWFDSFFLVTVTGIGPDPLGRVHGVLGAQAEPLRQLGNDIAPEALLCEAHRLAASDLVIACGTLDRNDESSEAWWIVSSSDVAADVVISRACGVAPGQLPVLRAFATHEVLPTVAEIGSDPPDLTGIPAPALSARVRATWAGMTVAGRALVRDVQTIGQNLRKVPNFVRRKMAARRGRAA